MVSASEVRLLNSTLADLRSKEVNYESHFPKRDLDYPND